MSVPRLGFNDFWGHAPFIFAQRGIRLKPSMGVFWGQTLQNSIQAAMDDGADGIITVDYDSLFKPDDLDNLMRLIHAYPEADAIVPMQMGRDKIGMMATRNEPPVTGEELLREMIPIDTGHFGLTFLRSTALSSMSKPWLQHSANDQGEYAEGKIDEDVYFWRKFKAEGKRAYLATKIVLGHLELMVKLPDKELNAIYQPVSEYHKSGKPPVAWA
jgi:hypothetical protein